MLGYHPQPAKLQDMNSNSRGYFCQAGSKSMDTAVTRFVLVVASLFESSKWFSYRSWHLANLGFTQLQFYSSCTWINKLGRPQNPTSTCILKSPAWQPENLDDFWDVAEDVQFLLARIPSRKVLVIRYHMISYVAIIPNKVKAGSVTQ